GGFLFIPHRAGGGGGGGATRGGGAWAAAERRLGAPAERIMVAGDDLTLEVRMARASGALAVLVTTGLHDRRAAAAAPPADHPDLVVDDLPELRRVLRAAGLVA
ncbi:MAG: HAD hydrolase-like protein, partial [Frankia sp.]|nr:HAD hydrolase-like protein [Frankia sp.]